jgi:hypothetical protein
MISLVDFCPWARRVLRVGHSKRAEVGQFWRAPRSWGSAATFSRAFSSNVDMPQFYQRTGGAATSRTATTWRTASNERDGDYTAKWLLMGDGQFPETPLERSRYRGGRYAWARLRPAFFAEPPCFAAGIGVGSFPWSVDHSIWHRENSILNGTKVPKCHSIPISAASAASNSGFLQTALSKTLNSSTRSGVFRLGVSDRVLTFGVNFRVADHSGGMR